METGKRSVLTTMLFIVYMLLLTAVILFKLPFYSPRLSDGIRVINLIPFAGSYNSAGNLILREIVQNIFIFIPFGIFICMLKSEWPLAKKAVTVIGLSLSFEVLQFIFALGRTDITDILDNSLGGFAGIGIYVLLFRIFKSRTVKVINAFALLVTIYAVLRFSHLFYLSHFVMRR